MIKLFTWGTPNGMKIQIMLEECGETYQLAPVNLGKKEQHEEQFLAINPNGKIPTIVDDDGPRGRRFVLWESGAILIYLSDKLGRFMPTKPEDRYQVCQWIMFQMSGLGPMVGQLHHFRSSTPEPIPYAINRYEKEGRRLLGVLDGQLSNRKYVAADEYTIADICMWPWVRSWIHTVHMTMDGLPNLRRWFDELEERPAIRRSVQVYNDLRNLAKPLAGPKS